MKIAIIGAGISGLTAAKMLSEKNDVIVFEKEKTPGGLIRCKRVNGNLFHICGGHVFNSKREDVLAWFWSQFDKEREFSKADRNSVVYMQSGIEIPYPIENHMYQFDEDIQRRFINDLITIARSAKKTPKNFEEFLKGRFGSTLYDIYFRPYNEKVWRRDLSKVPLSWLEGKLPMPTVEEMIYNNINHIKEKSFVHSTFWYEKKDGSQYIVDKISNGLHIEVDTSIESMTYDKNSQMWNIAGFDFDRVIYCGNIKDMIRIIRGVDVSGFKEDVTALEYHGTTAVFCEIDKNPYSWIYQPSKQHESHRIICTGNFAASNNNNLSENRITATIEFTDEIGKEEIIDNLNRIPLQPKYLDHHYNKYTYPIQDCGTREMIKNLKVKLAPYGFYFSGRFADWEYYNMDVAIGAMMDLIKNDFH